MQPTYRVSWGFLLGADLNLPDPWLRAGRTLLPNNKGVQGVEGTCVCWGTPPPPQGFPERGAVYTRCLKATGIFPAKAQATQLDLSLSLLPNNDGGPGVVVPPQHAGRDAVSNAAQFRTITPRA